MSTQTNYMIIDGVMMPIGAASLPDLEMPLRILGALTFVGLLAVAGFILCHLPVVSA